MNSDQHSDILKNISTTALDAAVLASKHVMTYWPNPLNKLFDKDRVMEIFEKNEGVGNYATIADTESEEIIINKIQENPLWKDHGILAEETGSKVSDSEYTWIIDPIDGTLNFRNGMTDFGISIGVVKGNEAIIGIIAMPALNQILFAQKGHGAKLLDMNGKELLDLKEIQYTESFDKALISYDTGYEGRVQQMKDGVEKIADKIGYPVAYASSSAANYRVAMGHVAAYFHQTPTKYDIGAAAVIISEVGGVVTDMQGNPIDWSAPNVSYLAARTPELHQKLLELLEK